MNCTKCGETNPPGRKFCRQCGTPLVSATEPREQMAATGGTTCAQCGATLSAGKAFCTRCGTPVKTTAPQPPPEPVPSAQSPVGSIQASLARLGIRLSRRELLGFALSVVAGIVMARILPYIYPVIFGHFLDLVFGPGAGARDTFNSHMMTAITFLTSFVISFFTFRKPRGG